MTDRVKSALAITLELTNTRLSDHALLAMLRVLEDHPEPAILAALDRCQREVKYRLTLADILERLPGQPPDADAAWEEALRLEVWNESRTLVVLKAIVAAFPFALWNAGDRVAARMAFKSRYPEALAEHGNATHVSLGHTAEQREEAIRDATATGRLTHAEATRALTHAGSGTPQAAPEQVKAEIARILGHNPFAPPEAPTQRRRAIVAQRRLKEAWAYHDPQGDTQTTQTDSTQPPPETPQNPS